MPHYLLLAITNRIISATTSTDKQLILLHSKKQGCGNIVL